MIHPAAHLTLAQAEGAAVAGLGALVCCFWIVYLAIIVAVIVGLWKMFVKAGKPGWAAIVPIYNIIVMLEIIGRPLWWIILFFIPIANIVVGIITCLDLAKSFGRGAGTAVGLILVPFIFIPILGFGSAQYVGPAVKAA